MKNEVPVGACRPLVAQNVCLLEGGVPDVKKQLVYEQLEPLIFSIRGHRVLLDADLARLYEVSTKRFNEAFRRNRRRFPTDFAFQLTTAEFNLMRSQIATGSAQVNDSSDEKTMWSQFATTSGRRRRTTYRPWAFTEHGALMAANILRSERAVQMSVFVVRAFVRLREHVAANTAVLKRLARSTRRCFGTTPACATFSRSSCRFCNRLPIRPDGESVSIARKKAGEAKPLSRTARPEVAICDLKSASN